MCVLFDEDRISGLELLERSGVSVVGDRSTLGAAVCKLDGTGCSSGRCFCRYPAFWGYWTREAGGRRWIFSQVGASDRIVRDGSMDGWSWGEDGEPPPPPVELGKVCSSGGTPAAARRPLRALASGEGRARPNYVPFLALLALVSALGSVLYLRRRRAT